MIVRSKTPAFVGLNALLLAALVTSAGSSAVAQSINLGSAASFAVLGADSITNTGPTVVGGDLGLSPGTSFVGFAPGVVIGSVYLTDSVALAAQTDALAAYNQLDALSFTSDLSGTNLGERTLGAGVYSYSSNAGMDGVLTLDGGGQSNARFVFQITSALDSHSSSSFNLINGASAANIWFQVGTSATLESNSFFVGTLIASESISLKTGADVTGRIIALNGAITLDNNTINVSAIPEPANYGALVSGLALFTVVGTRRRNQRTA